MEKSQKNKLAPLLQPKRRKYAILALIIYWPAIFIITHTPVPELVKKAHVSDKAIHFVAYMLLAFLFWIAFLPYKKVNWTKKASWLALLAVSFYGMMDEYLQGFVGRNANLPDFLANFTGALTGMILLTILPFWHALLIAAGLAIFIIANIAKTNPNQLIPLGYALFNIFAYAAFTQIWIELLARHTKITLPRPRWYLIAAAIPLLFTYITAISAILTKRPYSPINFIITTGAIILTLLINHLIHAVKHKSS